MYVKGASSSISTPKKDFDELKVQVDRSLSCFSQPLGVQSHGSYPETVVPFLLFMVATPFVSPPMTPARSLTPYEKLTHSITHSKNATHPPQRPPTSTCPPSPSIPSTSTKDTNSNFGDCVLDRTHYFIPLTAIDHMPHVIYGPGCNNDCTFCYSIPL